MTDICLDANVLIACLTPEESQDECLELIQRAESRMLNFFEPALLLYEVSSTLHRKVRSGDITTKESMRALELVYQLPFLFQWQQSLMLLATEYARELKFDHAYDCSYLAVAAHRNIPLVTLDHELYKKGRRVYSQVFEVTEFTRKYLK